VLVVVEVVNLVEDVEELVEVLVVVDVVVLVVDVEVVEELVVDVVMISGAVVKLHIEDEVDPALFLAITFQ
jgi:hypothetical protein